MNKNRLTILGATCLTLALTSHNIQAEGLAEAFTSGKAYGDFNLRYESVSQDNALDDATALTLRTRLGYKTGSIGGWSALVEFEDSSVVLGIDDYTVGPTGFNVGEYSVIADPETTELDQAFIQYKNELVTVKYGSQVITLDGHRHVGHVGWRQDRQTFDAFTAKFTPSEDLAITVASIDQRNRIFAEVSEPQADDILLNLSYKTGSGKFVVYNYAIENEGATDSLDTFGASYAGKAGSFLYAVEFANQELGDSETTYSLLEGGYKGGGFVVKAGLETLGSDDGARGFATPLATLHKFNGWADQFLGTPAAGLEDFYVMFGTKFAGGSFKVFYHDFNADEGDTDFGSEIDVVYAKKFAKNYRAGIKAALYTAGDAESGKVDADKIWIWTGFKF